MQRAETAGRRAIAAGLHAAPSEGLSTSLQRMSMMVCTLSLVLYRRMLMSLAIEGMQMLSEEHLNLAHLGRSRWPVLSFLT
jgi:hypothetical protein